MPRVIKIKIMRHGQPHGKTAIINLAAIAKAPLRKKPYPFMLGEGFLNPSKIAAVRQAFPQLKKPGYLTVDEVQLQGAFKQLIEELEGPELTAAFSKKFGIDLTDCPRLTTIMQQSQAKYGAIHTDGPSKVMTMLVYMNDDWREDGPGRLRVLYDKDNFTPFAAEVPPTMGTVFAFLRGEHSWHGHEPYVGERKVVQVAWLTDVKELERKKKRNSLAQRLKGIFGR